ncbi:MAG: tetratricopeptide repeat protein [Bryobacteraceae bacterium]|nr:tetratricopeptide repeat protein [Bryobacteraceae bacterium]MCX7604018.1 tetratricopeptide repeat protein [Bryobacteraceae bacterium]
MRAFWAGDYEQAIGLFEQAAAGRDISIAESARMHVRMCQRRLDAARSAPKTPEEHYLYAVSLMNAQQYSEARPHLEKAVAADPRPDYHYALALTLGMLGNMDEAAASLRTAIEADSNIRRTAKNDPDFAPLLENALIRETLAGGEAGS